MRSTYSPGGERLDHEAAARVRGGHRGRGAERRHEGARQRAAALVADHALDAAEGKARLLAWRMGVNAPGRPPEVWADTDATVNPTIAAAARNPVRRVIGFPRLAPLGSHREVHVLGKDLGA